MTRSTVEMFYKKMFDSPNVRQLKKVKKQKFVRQKVANKSNNTKFENKLERNIENRLGHSFLTFCTQKTNKSKKKSIVSSCFNRYHRK